jgi:hypothetical protein
MQVFLAALASHRSAGRAYFESVRFEPVLVP